MKAIECHYCGYEGKDFVQRYGHTHDRMRGYVHVMTRHFCPRCHHSFFEPYSDVENTLEGDKTHKELLERWKRIKPHFRECERCGQRFFFDFDTNPEAKENGEFKHHNWKYCSSLCGKKAEGDRK